MCLKRRPRGNCETRLRGSSAEAPRKLAEARGSSRAEGLLFPKKAIRNKNRSSNEIVVEDSKIKTECVLRKDYFFICIVAFSGSSFHCTPLRLQLTGKDRCDCILVI